MDATRVYLEVGARWTFACALDWPGWARRGRGDQAALEALATHRPRYAAVAGAGFEPGPVVVIGSVAGDASTDFGAPGRLGPWDDEPLSASEADRLAGLVEAAWAAFDAGVAAAPAALRTGPRGGGRQPDAMVEHVREAERSYASKFGVRVPPRTAWSDQRQQLAAALRANTPGTRWPTGYAARRLAWHVLDHLWEIEDRSV